MKMQSCFLVAVALILGTVCSEVLAQHFNANKPDECCFNFQQRPVPRNFFVGYMNLRDDCPNLGVISDKERTAIFIRQKECAGSDGRKPSLVHTKPKYEHWQEQNLILVAENGKRVCANPKYAWVKRHMNYFDQQAAKESEETPK